MPILWITGNKDVRFCEVAQELNFAHPLSRWVRVAEAGHRVPWVQPAEFKKCVDTFLGDHGSD
jgi:2-succinyl-6-hydroxy-2,4-cyclohexadiene-1-carboxylate synthase